MASPTSTFATLRALQLVIADALDDIQRVFSQSNLPDPPSSPPSQCPSPDASSFPATPPASLPPTPLSAVFPSSLRPPPHTDTSIPSVDYPCPDSPLVADSPSEQLALHPDAAAAASRIVAACGQMTNIVHKPFSSLCDAIMSVRTLVSMLCFVDVDFRCIYARFYCPNGHLRSYQYNLPACMRLVEHLHVVEIIREAEENGQRTLASWDKTALLLSDVKVDPSHAESAHPSAVSTSTAGIDGSRVHKASGMSPLSRAKPYGTDLVMMLPTLVVFMRRCISSQRRFTCR